MKRNLIIVGSLMVVTLLVYRLLSGDQFGTLSIAPYFVSLADAFLDGNLHLENPPSTYDLIFVDGKWYVAQQPLPAILMMPLVAVRGSFSDVTFGVLLGTVNVGLCYLVLTQYADWLNLTKRLLLTAFFAFGTPHFYLSVLGTVWFLGQIAATVFVWLFIGAVITERYFLAGAALGAVLLGRPSIVPAGLVMLAGWWWLHGELQLERIVKPMLRFAPFFLVAVLLLAGYNLARFDSPVDFGYDHLNDAGNIRERRREYGQFHPAFFPDNFYIATIKPLELKPSCLTDDDCGVFDTDLEGAGLLWTSPALLVLFVAWHGTQEEKRHVIVLAAVALVALLPSLFYHNNGSAQFGYRFALDAMPFLILLMAHGAHRTPIWLMAFLVSLSIGINIWGTVWYKTQLNL
ncbi:MAG: hypothetical protein L0154_15810 [Chloroflexi bacterium]|nr:hypothetical protein [Chloroflexota bacterium]